jgi:hypothetical protein
MSIVSNRIESMAVEQFALAAMSDGETMIIR